MACVLVVFFVMKQSLDPRQSDSPEFLFVSPSTVVPSQSYQNDRRELLGRFVSLA